MEYKWKSGRGLMSESEGQIVRVLRASEMEALLNAVDINDEHGNKSRKWLRQRNVTTEDVKSWFKFALFTGTRFGEAIVVHRDPSLLFNPYTIRIPNYPGAKRKRKTTFRNISLSYKGREFIPEFFDAVQLPSDDEKQVRQTLTSLSLILHGAADRINLDSYDFDIQIADGPVYTDDKGKQRKEKTVHRLNTNGVTFRSFRKTWESWLVLTFANDYLSHVKIAKGQGHDIETSMDFYTKILSGFDRDDRKEVIPWVDGYGEVD